MSDPAQKNYPDISDILQRKAEGCKESVARSFGEKIAMVERLRERLAPIRRDREARAAAMDRRSPPSSGSAG